MSVGIYTLPKLEEISLAFRSDNIFFCLAVSPSKKAIPRKKSKDFNFGY
jgi:hypothetical protein